jgi:hypothetical protein
MVEKLHASVSHEHKIRFMISPTEHPSIKLLMKSIRPKYTKPRQPVQPLELDHLRKMNQHLETLEIKDNLKAWRTVWRQNILNYTLCRFSEVNCLTTQDLTITMTPQLQIDLVISHSKSDQEGQGVVKSLYPINSDPLMCPVRLTQRYLARLAYPDKTKPYDGVLQPRIHFDAKLGIQIPLSNQVVGYSNCLEESKKLYSSLNILGRFGEHSGRRGGATTAASNGASIQDVQSLGNWKNSACALKYVDQSATNKERVSRLLYPK